MGKVESIKGKIREITLNIKAKILAVMTAALLTLGMGGFLNPNVIFASTSFQGGNFNLVSNTNSPAWVDPVNANVGDIVEFHVEIDNTGSEVAQNVTVQATFPSNISGTQIVSTATVAGSNATSMSDNAVINVNSGSIPAGATLSLTYFPGHATLIKHPGNVTSAIEQIGSGGAVSIGDLAVGSNVYAEVLFKAQIVANVSPTMTPTPTPTGTPSPTPTGTVTPTPTPTGTVTPTPTTAPGNNISCPSGFVAVISGSTIICMQQVNNQNQSVNINNSNTNTNSATGGSSSASATGGSVTNTVAAAAAVPVPVKGAPAVTELPKTGLPLAAWALSGLLPAGFGLRRFTKKNGGITGTARYIWQKREFDK